MCVLSTFSDPRAGRCPGCPRGENGTLPAACPDPSSFHRPAKAHPPLSICPAGGIFNRPIRAGAAPPRLPVSRSLALFPLVPAPPLPRRALPLAPPPSSRAPSPRLPVSVPPSRSLSSPPRLPVFRFLATFPPAHARPSRRVSLLFVYLPLTFSLPPRKQRFLAAPAAGGYHGETHREGHENKDPLPPRRQEGITAKHTGRGAKTKTPCRPGGRGISETFRDGGRAVPDATPAYRMRTRITPFVPARARAVSSLGQEAMSMSV